MKIFITLSLLFSLFNLSAQNETTLLLSEDVSLEEFLAKEISSTPIAITSLEANIDYAQKCVQLTWTSTPLTKSNQFIIEKSADKNTWETVATVFGSSHINRSTEFLHSDYNLSENISYYRLKQVEIFSNVFPVKYIKTKNNIAGINLYPSTSENNTTPNIAYEEVFEKEILLVIRDNKGDEFYSKALLNLENEAIVATPIEKEIPSGDYLITATSENQIYSQNIKIK
ncbi:MAG: hypothetical protein J5I47_07115 [Vicingus serpentipes]|nr:hypothetical protein [Vicingus serpentipes]